MLLATAARIHNMVAAGGPDIEGGSSSDVIEGGGIFDIVQRFFTLIGVVIVIIVLWRVVKAFAKGDFAGVAKVGIGGIIAAALCFNIAIPIGIVDSLGGVVKAVFDTLGSVAGGEGG